MIKIVTIIVALFVCNSAYSQVIKKRDTVFFNNGTVVIGKIKKVKLGVVTFDPDDANDITVQLRKLKAMSGGINKVFRIETVTDSVYFGTILAGRIPNTIDIVTGPDTVNIRVIDISILYPSENSVAQRFSGSVSVGYSYTKSSGLGRLNYDGTLRYLSRKSEITFGISGIYNIYDSLFSRDKEDINLKYNYYFAGNWFATAFLVYQRNLELGLDRRYQQGIGIGNKFITSKSVYTWGRGGVVFNQERSTENIKSGLLAELFGQLEVNIFRFEHPKVNFVMTQAIYYSLSQSGRFRNDGLTTLTWEIFKDFNFKLEPYNNYDSKPPVEGKANFDFGVVFGITYKF